jgi:ABC-2 type transport system permease protein
LKILNVAYYTIVKNFRDRKSLSLTVLFPILLILILGTALNQAYAPDKIDKIGVVYLSQDQGDLSKKFEDFLNSDSIKSLLSVQKVKSYAEGKKQVDDKNAASFIFINSKYTSNAMKGQKSIVEVYQSNDNLLSISVVKNIIDSFVNGANTMTALYKMGSSDGTYKSYSNIKEMPIKTAGSEPRAIDYYAVTMLAMTLMYGALYGTFSMAEDKLEKTYIRIKSAPMKAYENYLGKIIGTLVTLVLQALMLIFFTKFVFQCNWGANMTAIILISVLFAFCTSALGIMAFSLTNDSMKASGILNVLVVCFTFLSGGYAKINADGTLFEKLSYLSPNKLFQTAIFNTIYGGSAQEAQLCILALIGLTIVMLTIATIFGRRELI